MPRHWKRRLAQRLGFHVTSPAHGLWLVESSRSGRSSARVRALDETTWLLERGERRRSVRVGDPTARTELLLDETAARADIQRVHQELSDWLLMEQVAWVLRDLNINCVLDVGANVGQFATGLRRAGYTGRIVSFEPLPALVQKLSTKAERDEDWLVFACGLGDEDAEAEINVTPGTMSSLLGPSRFGRRWSPRLRDVHPEPISVRRLDSVLDDATAGIENPRVYLKLDTQGYDIKAFRGASSRLANILAMQSEVSCLPIYEGMPRLPEQIGEYEAAGFEIAGMFPVSRHRTTLRIIEFDVVMVRAEAVRAARA